MPSNYIIKIICEMSRLLISMSLIDSREGTSSSNKINLSSIIITRCLNGI